MSSYQPPTESLSVFNSAVFDDANTESLSLSKAQSLFLGRTGNPTSVATTTTFNNSITAGSGIFNGNVNLQSNRLLLGNIKLSSNPTYDYINFTSSFAAGNQSNSIAIGTGTTAVSPNSIAIGQDCKAIGYGSNICIGNSANVDTSTAGNNLNIICIGNGASSNGADDHQIAIGSNSSCNGTSSSIAIGRNSSVAALSSGSNVALGYSASVGASGIKSMALGSGASATLANQIVLGTATETVYAVGTASTGSLVASNDIFVKGTIRAGMGVNTTYTTPATSFNTCLGLGALSDANMATYNCTAIGYNALIKNQSGYGSTAVGTNALAGQVSGGSNTAVGTNALFTLSNSGGNNIALGEQAGYTNNSINNAFLGWYSGKLNTGGSNVFVGAASGNATTGSSDNVMVGSNSTSLIKCTTGNQNTFIGSKIICNGTTGVSNSTALGYGSSVDTYSNSTAIGVGSVCTANNQIMLGRSSETVVCDKIAILPTTNGANIIFPTSITSNSTGIGGLGIGWNLSGIGRTDFMALGQAAVGGYTFNVSNTSGNAPTRPLTIELNELISTVPIRLQSTYTAGAGAGQLGQVVSGSSIGFSVTNAVAVSFASLTSLAAGVWAFNYTIDLTTAGGTATATIQSLYMTLTNNGAYNTKVAYGGSTRTHSTVVYAIADNPCFSSSIVYSTTATTSFYPTFLISFTGAGATISANGYATATRIG